MARDDSSIPSGRIRRTAEVGSVVGGQGARYAGTRAANIARSKEGAADALERRHLEAAERMVETLGRMKGAAMKIGQLASFIDTEFLPPEYRELYQEQLATLRSTAPPMPWKKVRSVLDEEWEDPVEDLFEDFEHDAAAAASIGQVHRAVLPDGRRVAVKVQYPGVASAISADMQNAGLILRMAKTLAPGLDAKRPPRSSRSGCWRSSTTSWRRRTSERSPAATAAIPSSMYRTWSPACPPPACW
jgi:predicted unusual protein kinase regulating ubiquinone biosynthesis (AarF/ABC1/UbiB family)